MKNGAASARIVAASLLLFGCTDIYQMSVAPSDARILLATRDHLVKACENLERDGIVCLWGDFKLQKVGKTEVRMGHLALPKDRDPRYIGPDSSERLDYFFAWMQITPAQVVDGYQLYQGTMNTAWFGHGTYSIRHGFDDISWNVANKYLPTLSIDGSDQSTALAAFAKQAHADEVQVQRDAEVMRAQALHAEQTGQDRERINAARARDERARQWELQTTQAQADKAAKEKRVAKEKTSPRWYVVEPKVATCEPIELINRRFSDPDALLNTMRQERPYAHIDYSKHDKIAVIRDYSDGLGDVPVNFYYSGWDECMYRATQLHHLLFG